MTDRELFIAVFDRPEAERNAWLDAVCGDAEQRRRLAVLLRAHEEASLLLAGPPVRDEVSSADPAKEPVEEILGLLEPSETPGHLGRLGMYEIVEVVGSGGMGVVVKAFDGRLHRVVAIKLLAPRLAVSPSARKRFEREARAVAAVKNEHVVAIHAVEITGPSPYLVMEFVGGISLQERLERRGPMDVKEILRIGVQTAKGLAAAHAQGLVHRDVKPANILLENGVERVKLTDFGLARAVDDVSLTQSGVISGTPNYMSPEQADGRPVDARSDLFSLGSVLYALAAGHPPFRAEGVVGVLKRVACDTPRPLREVNPDVPEWLEAVVGKLHAKNPDDRFSSASEVAELLEQHLAHLQQPTRVPRPRAVEAAKPVLEPTVAVEPEKKKPKKPATVHGFWLVFLLGLVVAIDLLGVIPYQGVSWVSVQLRLAGYWGLSIVAIVAWLVPRWRGRLWAVLGCLALTWSAYALVVMARTPDPAHLRIECGVPGVSVHVSATNTWHLTNVEAHDLAVPPGVCRIRAMKDNIEVYSREFYLHENQRQTVRIHFPGDDAPPPGRAVIHTCILDPAVELIVTDSERMVYVSSRGVVPSAETPMWTVRPYQLQVKKAGKLIHDESFRLIPGQMRNLFVPTVVEPTGTVELRRANGERLTTGIRSMRLAPDRKTVAVGLVNGPIVVCDAATGKERFTVARPDGDCIGFTYTPDGGRLVYAVPNELRAVAIGDWQTSDVVVKGKWASVRAVAFSPDGKRLAASCDHELVEGVNFGSQIHRWEQEKPGAAWKPLAQVEWQEGAVEELRFTPTGNELLALGGKPSAVAWDWATGEPDESGGAGALDTVASGAARDYVAGWDEAKKRAVVMVWKRQVETPPEEWRPLTNDAARLGSLAVSPDGGLVAGGTKGTDKAAWEQRAAVHLWDAKTGDKKAVLLGHADWVLDLAFTADGTIVSVSKDGTVRTWRLPVAP